MEVDSYSLQNNIIPLRNHRNRNISLVSVSFEHIVDVEVDSYSLGNHFEEEVFLDHPEQIVTISHLRSLLKMCVE